MMISRRDSNKNLKKISVYIAIFVVIIFLWSPFKSLSTPVLESLGFFSSRVYSYISNTLNQIHLYTASNESLYQENILLNSLLTEEKAKYFEMAILKNDIQKYQNLVSASSTTSLFAKRIGSIDTLVHDTFRINKNVTDGIRVGQLVVGPQNTLIGIVKEVDSKTSLVSLLWNGSTVLARTSTNGMVITLKGVDDGVYLVEVPHEINFALGDIITYDANPDLIIGTVKKIKENEGDRAKEIFIHIPFHPNMIDVVSVEEPL